MHCSGLGRRYTIPFAVAGDHGSLWRLEAKLFLTFELVSPVSFIQMLFSLSQVLLFRSRLKYYHSEDSLFTQGFLPQHPVLIFSRAFTTVNIFHVFICLLSYCPPSPVEHMLSGEGLCLFFFF